MSQTRVAVVTGKHGFDVIAFHQLFRALPDADPYIQHMEDFAGSSPETRRGYDVIVFYNMHRETPTGSEASYVERGSRAAIEELGRAGQGLFIFHHAILAYPEWPLWSEIVGIEDRRFGFKHGLHLRVQVADGDHPITQGIEDFEIVDEVYSMRDAGEGSRVLLTVDHPESMRTVGWTRRYRESPVFCFQLGHDGEAFANPHLRQIVGRGIAWCAGRL
jgi:uncharacterized protein